MIKVCSRCVMDETARNIQFDENGVCNFCTDFKERYVENQNEKKRATLVGMRTSKLRARTSSAAANWERPPRDKKRRLDVTATPMKTQAVVHPWPRHAVNLQHVVAMGARLPAFS